jgi:Ni,Fe-hydrogenase III component G
MSVMEQIKDKFGTKIEISLRSYRRVYINAPKVEVEAVIRFLYTELGARFSIATGLDTQTGVEILYHMAFDREGLLVSVRTLVEKPELEINSFTGFMPSAEWIEREIHEMLGVKFLGHPNLERLLLPDDWPEGVYPYRKKSYGSEKEVPEK